MEKASVGRPKKDGKYINCYAQKELIDELEEFCRKTGLSKTTSIEHAIRLYLDNYAETKEI